MKRVSTELCAECKYRTHIDQRPACNYLNITKHSRIFEGRQMAYDPRFCNKYEKGEQILTCDELPPTFSAHSVRYRNGYQKWNDWE